MTNPIEQRQWKGEWKQTPKWKNWLTVNEFGRTIFWPTEAIARDQMDQFRAVYPEHEEMEVRVVEVATSNLLRRSVAFVMAGIYGVRGGLKPPLGGPHAGFFYPLRRRWWRAMNWLYRWSGLPGRWHTWGRFTEHQMTATTKEPVMTLSEIMRHAVTKPHPAGGFLSYIDGAAHRAYVVSDTRDGALTALRAQVSANLPVVSHSLKTIKGL